MQCRDRSSYGCRYFLDRGAVGKQRMMTEHPMVPDDYGERPLGFMGTPAWQH